MAKLVLSLICLSSGIIANANIVGGDIQNFNPSLYGLNFVTVDSSSSLSQGKWNFSVFADYSQKSLPFYQSTPVPGGLAVAEPNNTMIFAHLLLGYGITSNWDMGFGLGSLISKSEGDSTYLTSIAKTGMNHYRFNTKYRLLQNEHIKTAVQLGGDFLDDLNQPYLGTGAGHSWSGEILLDYKFSQRLIAAVNLGYKYRKIGTKVARSGVSPIGGQVLYSGALQYSSKFARWIFEVYGSGVNKSGTSPTDRELGNLEALLGLRKTFSDNWHVHGGLTKELTHGLATPEIRVYAGLQWQRTADSTEDSVTENHNTPKSLKITREPPQPQKTKTKQYPQPMLQFQFESTRLRLDSFAVLDQIIKNINLATATIHEIRVEGHSDLIGPAPTNTSLSQQRAQYVADRIQRETGIDPSKIIATGFGESNPLSDATSSRQHRRVQVILIKSVSN